MPYKKIKDLPGAVALDGTEIVPVVQNGITKRTTSQAIANLAEGEGGGGAVSSVAGKTGAVTLVKGDVGLADVDNTSDANKPVSTAQQTALNSKQNLVTLTTTGSSGVATFNQGTGALNIPNYAGGGGGAWDSLTGSPEDSTDLTDRIKEVSASPRTVDVRDFGAKCDRRYIFAATASGTSLVASVPTFAAGDVGKLIKIIYQDAAAGYSFATTIASYTDATHIVLAGAPPVDGGVSAVFGTNDLAAIQAAVDAIVLPDAYGNKGGTIKLGSSLIAGTVDPSSNGLITIPEGTAIDNEWPLAYVIKFLGEVPPRLTDYGEVAYWNPQNSTIIESCTNDAGWIISPIVTSFGFASGNNTTLHFENLVFRNMYGGAMSGVNGRDILPGFVVNSAVCDVEWMSPFTPPIAGTVGWAFPKYNNGTSSIGNNVGVFGYETGVFADEHFYGSGINVLLCLNAIKLKNGGGHPAKIDKALVHWCKYPLVSDGVVPVDIDMLTIEREIDEDFWYYTALDVNDVGNFKGRVLIANSGRGTAGKLPTFAGCSNLVIETTENTGLTVNHDSHSIGSYVITREIGCNAKTIGYSTNYWGPNDPNRSGVMLQLAAGDSIGKDYTRSGIVLFKRGYGSQPIATRPTGDFTWCFDTIDQSTVNFSFNYDHASTNAKAAVFIGNTPSATITAPTGAVALQAVNDAFTVTAGGGLVLPRMTKSARNSISSPVAGTAIYQTDNTPGLRVFNGTNWMKFTEATD